MRACPVCARENDASHRFCRSCGQALGGPAGSEAAPAVALEPGGRSCPVCHHRVPPSFDFCTQCGTRFVPTNAADLGAAGGGAAKPSRAVVVVIRHDGQELGEVPIAPQGTRVGRSVLGDLLSGDPYLSPLHATFWMHEGTVWVRDEGSVNGTFLRLRSVWDLHEGDRLRIGQKLLRFEARKGGVAVREDDGTVVLGSPSEGVWGRLVVVLGPQTIGDAYVLGGTTVRVGRERGEILFPDDGFVSARHAELYLQGRQPRLRDLGSSNGTFVRLRGPTRLADGDFLLLGQQLVLLRME